MPVSGFYKTVQHKIWQYLHQPVKVNAFGIQYKGIFKGADEDWVYLQSQTTWVQIPWLEISSFEKDDAVEQEFLEKRDFDLGPEPKEQPELKVIQGGREDGPGKETKAGPGKNKKN